jgi:hypothetical protein
MWLHVPVTSLLGLALSGLRLTDELPQGRG